MYTSTLYSYCWKYTASSVGELRVRCTPFVCFDDLSTSSIRGPNQKCTGNHEWSLPVSFELGDEPFRVNSWGTALHANSFPCDLKYQWTTTTSTVTLGASFANLGTAHTMSWRPLDSRLSRFEIRLSKHRRWLEKETENHVQHYADISHHRNNYLEFLHTQEQASGSSNVEQEGHINARRWRRVEKVRKWLHGSPESKQIDCRHASYDEESCAWFLQTPAYCNWRDQGFEKRMANDANFLMGNWQHRVLFVQGQSIL